VVLCRSAPLARPARTSSTGESANTVPRSRTATDDGGRVPAFMPSGGHAPPHSNLRVVRPQPRPSPVSVADGAVGTAAAESGGDGGNGIGADVREGSRG
jgi:hypothetical protein